MFVVRPWIISIFVALLAATTSTAGTYNGTVMGRFFDPQLTGQWITRTGEAVFLDNTTTAVYSGAGTDTLTWGTGGFEPFDYSTVAFRGATLVDAPANEPIYLGTLFYENGTSFGSTLIFGASFEMWVEGEPSIDPLSGSMTALATENTNFDPEFDADVLSFSFVSNTFHVYEGGMASVELWGSIVGDPYFDLLSLNNLQGNGFLGTGLLTPVPEPSTLVGFVVALGLLGVGRARRLI